ncbi:hypothetical protein Q7P37_009685 [Cladosporium fusiforme]
MSEADLEQNTLDCDEKIDDIGGHDAWQEWLVKLHDAYHLRTILTFESDFTPELYNEEYVAAHTDANGVFLLVLQNLIRKQNDGLTLAAAV